MNSQKIKYIDLSLDELALIKPIYDSKCCPKKCHTGEKRIWFIPKSLVYEMKNLDYTCCSYCYFNKDTMDLLNNKYKRDDLIPILSEGLDCNCDESIDTDVVSISTKLPDDILFSVYESNKVSKFLELDKVGQNIFNIYYDNLYTGNISFVLYKNAIKKEKKEGENDNDEDENENENLNQELNTIYAKIYEDHNDLSDFEESFSMSKSFIYNNELCMTISRIYKSNKLNKFNKILSRNINFNFLKEKKHTIMLEYSNNLNPQNKNIVEVNFINNKFNKNSHEINNYKIKKISI